jgi:lycopene beta-cyclase
MEYDLIFVGGGLASCISANSVLASRPSARILILEKQERLCGDHTWCFHGSDVAAESDTWAWLRPLTSHSWKSHSVKFPGFSREMAGHSYYMIRSEDLDRKARANPSLTIKCSNEATSIEGSSVIANGQTYFGNIILDSRPLKLESSQLCGYQKFVGLEVKTKGAHHISYPMLMDADVEQRDGFRFFYCMPIASDRLLIEDTRYSDSGVIDQGEFEKEINKYARRHKIEVDAVLYRESGVLPIPLTSDERFKTDKHGIGYRGGLFNPTTGYSFAELMRFTAWLKVALDEYDAGLPAAQFYERLASYRAEGQERQRFFYMLNRMLFGAAAPKDRWFVMKRFYTLNAQTIGRFYAGNLTFLDKLKILTGRPPVPVFAAMRSLLSPRIPSASTLVTASTREHV